MKIIILGAGDWGTALAAILAARPGKEVALWARSEERVRALKDGRGKRPLDSRVKVGVKFSEEVAGDDVLVIAVPSSEVRAVAKEIGARLNPLPILVSAAKGFEHSSLLTMSQVLRSVLPGARLAVLSGPNIAEEVARGQYSKAILASDDVDTLLRVRAALENDVLEFETSKEMVGVELCAALKGIIAIAVGLCEGVGLGVNAQAIVMTYGLREFAAVADFFGVPASAIYGLGGLGDLLATSMSPNSRNRRFGRLLAQGVPTQEALRQVGMVVEGVKMAQTVGRLDHLSLPTPIISTVSRFIFDPPADTRAELLKLLSGIRLGDRPQG